MIDQHGMKKWMMVSTFSAAGLSLATEAEANTIFTSVNQDVGFGSGQLTSLVLDLPGINDMQVAAGQFATVAQYVVGGYLLSAPGATYFEVKRHIQTGTVGAYAALLNQSGAGPVWGALGGTVGVGGVFGGQDSVYATVYGGNFLDKYFAFAFKDSTSGNALRYGWLQTDWTYNNRGNFNVHIDGYAYDDTGAQIPMGFVAAPDASSTSVLLGMAAMVMGAVEVRRWRQSKKAVAA